MRKTIGIITLLIAACSSEPAGDNGDVTPNNVTTAGSNNGTIGTSNGTPGTNNVTSGNSNNVATNNASTNNVATNNGMPRNPFAGVCNTPTFAPADAGCEYSWRCSESLTLSCKADAASPNTVTCECAAEGVVANSWSGSSAAVCSGDTDEITKLALDECGWAISYMETLRCMAGTSQGDATKCSWDWQCGDMTHTIDCAEDRGGQACTCALDGRPTGLAFPVTIDTCASDEADVLRLVRAGCGWDITTN